ncbi:MAG: alpha/beta hydrolase [Polyangiaceae bacterium]
MRVLLLHGLEGSPQGAKARALREHFELCCPALPTGDFAACEVVAQDALRNFHPEVLVGSSFGGALALRLIELGAWQGPTLLLAPASRYFLPAPVSLPAGVPVLILHGRKDAVVPMQDSRDLAERHDGVRLLELDDEHRLSTLTEGGRLAGYVREVRELLSTTSIA